MYTDISRERIHEVMELSYQAFLELRNQPLATRVSFMKQIADGLENSGDELIAVAMRETHLPRARLVNERARTVYQLRSYADACATGIWMEARIDRAIPDRNPPRPDIRKMNIGLGPVVVFGASNFPFAYSTAGGDTASAFAAGCPVVVKAHPAHPETSERVARIIDAAVQACAMPEGTFQHVYGASFETGKELVMHERTAAVGFTGSFSGGKQLYDWSHQRPSPIPVFAEMGSVNPVFLLPGKLEKEAAWCAEQLAGSITLGAGQFCTNPGLVIGIKSPELEQFIDQLAMRISGTTPAPMLHAGIYKGYMEKRDIALSQANVELLSVSTAEAGLMEGRPTIARASGQTFLNTPLLHQEVFGPYSLLVECADMSEMEEIVVSLEGQLTCSLLATEEEMVQHHQLVELLSLKCGRMILNGVPTGVEVCWSMQHGGPFPATTDARFGSVGPDAIRRFVRPLSLQNFPEQLLPDALKDGNPLSIVRMEDLEFRR